MNTEKSKLEAQKENFAEKKVNKQGHGHDYDTDEILQSLNKIK